MSTNLRKEDCVIAGRQRPTPEQLLAAARLADSDVLPAFIAALLQEPGPATSNYPLWVRRCAEKVIEGKYPKLWELSRNQTEPGPYMAGIAYGMMVGGAALLRNAEKLLPANMPEPTPEEAKNFWEMLHGTEAARLHPVAEGHPLAKEHLDGIKAFEEKLSGVELAEFHRGAAEATAMLAGKDQSTTTTVIHETMLTFWRIRFGSTVELHNFLTRALGQNVVGSDSQRIAQICKRIGRRFRGRGRPRKWVRPEVR